MESILLTTRKTVCGNEAAEEFDTDLIMHINSAISTLAQIGACPDGSIVDETTEWSDIFPDAKVLNFVQPYVYIKVRLGFDPPANQALITSMEKYAAELEWRVSAYVDRRENQNGN